MYIHEPTKTIYVVRGKRIKIDHHGKEITVRDTLLDKYDKEKLWAKFKIRPLIIQGKKSERYYKNIKPVLETINGVMFATYTTEPRYSLAKARTKRKGDVLKILTNRAEAAEKENLRRQIKGQVIINFMPDLRNKYSDEITRIDLLSYDELVTYVYSEENNG